MRNRFAHVLPLLLLLGVSAERAGAQDGERSLPTLESLGVGPWSNASGSLQLGLSGRLDLEGYLPGDDPTWLVDTTDPFFTPRLRLFADLFVGESWFASVEGRVDGGEAEQANRIQARVEQAFVRWTPLELVALQAGKFASPFGSYPSRHHTEDDWFIRPPLMYEYRTILSNRVVPETPEEFVEWKDDPELRGRGVPPVWAAPYQVGVMAFGAWHNLSWRAAYMNSAVSTGPTQWDHLGFERGNVVAALGYRFAPWVRAEVSYAGGPFLQRDIEREDIPEEVPHGPGWFTQQIFGAELLFQLYHTQVRAEAFHDTWEYLDAEPIHDISWSVEARQEFFQNAFLAGRFGQIRFSDVELAGEGSEPWDHNVQRAQIAAGYRFASNAEIRGEYLAQTNDGPVDRDDDLISVQLWWAF